jgi:SAM-dependent methyltransferase
MNENNNTHTEYSVDWFSNNIPIWNQLFQKLNFIGKSDLRFLEIGCFEGRATNFMLDNILTGDNCTIDVIDTFGGSLNESGMHWDDTFEFEKLYNTFKQNIHNNEHRVKIHRGYSGDVLRELSLKNKEHYDFVYVDGSHTAYGVLEDAILVHPMLKTGGVIIFDDYLWKDPKNLHPTNSPELAVQCFYNVYEPFYDVVIHGYQVGLIKKKG